MNFCDPLLYIKAKVLSRIVYSSNALIFFKIMSLESKYSWSTYIYKDKLYFEDLFHIIVILSRYSDRSVDTDLEKVNSFCYELSMGNVITDTLFIKIFEESGGFNNFSIETFDLDLFFKILNQIFLDLSDKNDNTFCFSIYEYLVKSWYSFVEWDTVLPNEEIHDINIYFKFIENISRVSIIFMRISESFRKLLEDIHQSFISTWMNAICNKEIISNYIRESGVDYMISDHMTKSSADMIICDHLLFVFYNDTDSLIFSLLTKFIDYLLTDSYMFDFLIIVVMPNILVLYFTCALNMYLSQTSDSFCNMIEICINIMLNYKTSKNNIYIIFEVLAACGNPSFGNVLLNVFKIFQVYSTRKLKNTREKDDILPKQFLVEIIDYVKSNQNLFDSVSHQEMTEILLFIEDLQYSLHSYSPLLFELRFHIVVNRNVKEENYTSLYDDFFNNLVESCMFTRFFYLDGVEGYLIKFYKRLKDDFSKRITLFQEENIRIPNYLIDTFLSSLDMKSIMFRINSFLSEAPHSGKCTEKHVKFFAKMASILKVISCAEKIEMVASDKNPFWRLLLSEETSNFINMILGVNIIESCVLFISISLLCFTINYYQCLREEKIYNIIENHFYNLLNRFNGNSRFIQIFNKILSFFCNIPGSRISDFTNSNAVVIDSENLSVIYENIVKSASKYYSDGSKDFRRYLKDIKNLLFFNTSRLTTRVFLYYILHLIKYLPDKYIKNVTDLVKSKYFLESFYNQVISKKNEEEYQLFENIVMSCFDFFIRNTSINDKITFLNAIQGKAIYSKDEIILRCWEILNPISGLLRAYRSDHYENILLKINKIVEERIPISDHIMKIVFSIFNEDIEYFKVNMMDNIIKGFLSYMTSSEIIYYKYYFEMILNIIRVSSLDNVFRRPIVQNICMELFKYALFYKSINTEFSVKFFKIFHEFDEEYLYNIFERLFTSYGDLQSVAKPYFDQLLDNHESGLFNENHIHTIRLFTVENPKSFF